MICVNVADSPHTLTPFTLSQPLVSVVHTLSTRLPTHRSKIVYTPSQPAPSFILALRDEKIEYSLEFSSISQSLVAITYHLQDHAPSLRVIGCRNDTFEGPISIDDIKQVCGEPINYHGDGVEKLSLVYKESCFTFAVKNNVLCLRKIKIAYTDSFTASVPQVNFIVSNSPHPIVGLTLCTGISRKTSVYFGDQNQDILSKLGAASEIFYPANSDVMILSYKHLGLALVVDSCRHILTKVILYANNPPHRDFCVYSRCSFELSLSKTSVCTDYMSCDSLLVTPVTNWSVITKYVGANQVRNIGILRHGNSTNNVCLFPNTTLHTLFDDIIFEVTSTGNIAAITIPSHDSHMTNSYPHQCPTHAQTQFSQINLETIDSLPRNSEDSDEDSFQSAQSSLQSEASLESPKDERKMCKALIGTNLNIVVDQRQEEVAADPMPNDRCVYYDFTSHSPHTHTHHTVLYESDSLQIHSTPGEELTPKAEDEDEFEMVSFDDLQEQSDATLTSTEPQDQEEPEFLYQPKSTTISTSMMSSRTMGSEKDDAKSRKSRLLSHTHSSGQRVRSKYVKPTPSEEESQPSHDEVSSLSLEVHSCEEDSPPFHKTTFPSLPQSPEIVSPSTCEGKAPSSSEGETPPPPCEAESSLLYTAASFEKEPLSADDPPLLWIENDLPPMAPVSKTDTVSTSAASADSTQDSLNLTASEKAPSAIGATLGTDATATVDLTPPSGSVPELEVGVATRGEWVESQWTLDTGPPSMTKERVLEELVSCEHNEVKTVLQERLETLVCVKQLLCSTGKKAEGELDRLLSEDPTLAHALIASLNKSNSWFLSYSAMLLPWIQQVFASEKNSECLLSAARAVLCVADKHTTLLLRHKIGRARSLSVPERRQCIKCYVTLEKIDEIIDGILSNKAQLHSDEEELLSTLRNVRTALAKIFKKVDLA